MKIVRIVARIVVGFFGLLLTAGVGLLCIGKIAAFFGSHSDIDVDSANQASKLAAEVGVHAMFLAFGIKMISMAVSREKDTEQASTLSQPQPPPLKA
jgi:hypothetical protein